MKPVPASAAVVGLLVKGDVVEPAQPHFAAIVEVNEQPMVAVVQIDRLEDEDVHRVLDLAARVARRHFDVGDHGVARIAGIELAKGGATELLVLADRSEGEAFQTWATATGRGR